MSERTKMFMLIWGISLLIVGMALVIKGVYVSDNVTAVMGSISIASAIPLLWQSAG